MTNCIVTGGAGYVGSHCCKELAKAGYTPVTVDNLFRGHRELVKWGPFCECDVLDTERLAAIFEEYKPEAVFHFASTLSGSQRYSKSTSPRPSFTSRG